MSHEGTPNDSVQAIPLPTAKTVQTDPQPVCAAEDLETGGARLITLHPTGTQHEMVHLGKKRIMLGRGSQCDVCVSDSAASRVHASIELREGEFVLIDLHSTNGTYVNDERVRTHQLSAGDQIRIGLYVFKFLAAEDLEAQYHEAVYSMMTRDGLTGVFNRQFFVEVLETEIAAAKQSGSPLSVLLIDADDFKVVNDQHGHLVGDEVLRELARRLGNTIRTEDTLARYGGEEFAILLPDTPHEGAMSLAERCVKNISEKPCPASVGPIRMTISVGAASTADIADSCDAEQLLQTADGRLYQAKEAGRNQVTGVG